ncbi:MAG: preprotein translocase subunit SecA [bacterium]
MLPWVMRHLVGTKNQRDVRRLRPLVEQINQKEIEYQTLTEEALKAKTTEFRARLVQGAELDSLLCEAFAVVKNACRRLCGQKFMVCGHELAWDMVPFDTQVLGGIVLHQGKIAEMATGEGKTLVATMPLYLNALTGNNVHLVTVNDYLARRDAQWMGQVLQYLGMTVGCIQNQMSPSERREEYGKNITYGTNSEFGFDYLRDHGMAWRPEDQVQRGYYYAIVDEIDSILIDEARTPLIISGPAPVSTHQYAELNPRVERLYRRQVELCNRIVAEAKQAWDKGDQETAKRKIYQVRHGMPKNKQLAHLLEDQAARKLSEQVEGAMTTDMYKEEARALREEMFFTVDEKGHDANLTEKGCEAMSPDDPEAYVIPDLVSIMSDLDGRTDLPEDERLRLRSKAQDQFGVRSERIHNVDQLIRAYCIYECDVEYVVQDNQVLIVDEFTGRILPGRRWSDGLHQAVEAKEGVKIERETQTLATITIQNYFRLYKKLSGMTGTAETEADEFSQIYKLDVIVIPTNRPVRRVDNNDSIYKTQREKYKSLLNEIVECHTAGQPVLVGTVSVDSSELLSRMLTRAKIPHSVLNAKNHEREADIVASAGQKGQVTIATNMAGRGTDIKLGAGVVWVSRDQILGPARLQDKQDGGKTLRQLLIDRPCGLHVIGSERHESRRIDRQLRGRCARQGDPGSSRFYVSLEDDLMRLFGSDRIAGIMERLGLEEGEVLEHRWLNRSIETAQRRVEQQNFSIRKRTLQYDDVTNKQRKIIYGFRGEIVRSTQPNEILLDVLYEVIAAHAENALGPRRKDEGLDAFITWIRDTFPVVITPAEVPVEGKDTEPAARAVFEKVRKAYALKWANEPLEMAAMVERSVMLDAIDSHWQDYLRSMDQLRQSVGLRAYGQRDPLVEYKRDAFEMFENLMDDIREDIATRSFRAQTERMARAAMNLMPTALVHEQVSVFGGGGGAGQATGQPAQIVQGGDEAMQSALKAGIHPVKRDMPKVGRNDTCPCGSGKKYKKCCGAGS